MEFKVTETFNYSCCDNWIICQRLLRS
jgi:hypothetical protein